MARTLSMTANAAGLAFMLMAGGCAEDGGRAARRDGSAASTGEDSACLRFLERNGVPFAPSPETRGVRTPVEITGPFAGLRLTPRVKRAPVMDCELARALAEAAPLFHEAGIDQLSFSGAYDYRTRRHSSKLSEHAHGLAIDVHAFDGPDGPLVVARDFERGRGAWRHIVARDGNIDACVGAPRTNAGLRLRQLVCRLKHHSAFRVIITPDDDSDHRDHVHLEAFPDVDARVTRVLGTMS